MPFPADLVFLHPWLLAILTTLPLLWLILRITPPAPQRLKLPTVRFLEGLKAERQAASRTPWWLLLLRLLILACLIIAFAHPVHKPSAPIAAGGKIRLVIDNGWESASHWNSQIAAAMNVCAVAERGNSPPEIEILTTASAPGEKDPFHAGPLSPAEAKTILKSLEPHPWPADYTAALNVIKTRPQEGIRNIWFSAGLHNPGLAGLANGLLEQGPLDFYAPSSDRLPVLLRKAEENARNMHVTLEVPDNTKPGTSFVVQAVSKRGGVIEQKSLTWKSAGIPLAASFNIPQDLRSQLAGFKIGSRAGAGGIYNLASVPEKRTVGIIGGAQKDVKPFVEARYYIRRALEPYATILEGTYNAVLESEPSVIIIPDGGNIPVDALRQLEEWVKKGGLLLRFAGPDMAAYNGVPYLLPVQLRKGERAAGGTLSWNKTAKLKNFSDISPFNGIKIPEDIPVRRQILAESSDDLSEKTWAILDDGTPLITAAPLEDGLIVLFHIAPLPEWSDLPLSGAFVEILNRIVAISGTKYKTENTANKMLLPLWILDGFGKKTAPPDTTQPVTTENFENTKIDSLHPPGAYGTGSFEKILNLGDRIETLRTVDSLPANVTRRGYDQNYERDYKPDILLLALCLLLLDWSVSIVMMRGFRLKALSILMLCICFSSQSQAADFKKDSQYAEGFYLAYVRTGDSVTDSTSQRGLENLTKILQARTSAEPVGVIAVNPAEDTLVFFPFLYWPISSNAGTLSPETMKNIQNYLDNGGTILFDTRDGSEGTGGFGMSSHSQKLQLLLAGFNIPALQSAPKDHVLMRSFYLLRETPGRFKDGMLWVEEASAPGRDGVSSVIIGTYDWSGAWASPHADTQQELAFRFGVNMVIYALTGNYKADQVHVSHILERLGQ